MTASLRTQILPEAMKRAAALLAAMELIERRILAQSAAKALDAGAIRLIVAEVVREALAGVAESEESTGLRTEAEADAGAAELVEVIQELRKALRCARAGQPFSAH